MAVTASVSDTNQSFDPQMGDRRKDLQKGQGHHLYNHRGLSRSGGQLGLLEIREAILVFLLMRRGADGYWCGYF